MKILIVDDSKVARLFINDLLGKYNRDVTVLEAENGREGVTLFEKEQPDITLLDLTMPVMDGFEALREIKALKKEAAVLILTADIQQKAVERCMDLGAEAVLPKLPREKDLFLELDRISEKNGL